MKMATSKATTKGGRTLASKPTAKGIRRMRTHQRNKLQHRVYHQEPVLYRKSPSPKTSNHLTKVNSSEVNSDKLETPEPEPLISFKSPTAEEGTSPPPTLETILTILQVAENIAAIDGRAPKVKDVEFAKHLMGMMQNFEREKMVSSLCSRSSNLGSAKVVCRHCTMKWKGKLSRSRKKRRRGDGRLWRLSVT
jgi:hypothetical protein